MTYPNNVSQAEGDPMRVREIMTSDVAYAAPDTTLEEIAVLMRDENVGAIPVLDEEVLVGLVTDRDIVVRCIAEGKDASERTAEDVISENLETVEPEDDVDEAAQIMARRQVRRLPVVEDGKLVGMLSLGDIAVKQSDDRAGEALESVSEGVRPSRAARLAAKPAQAEAQKRKNRAAARQDMERGDANTARMIGSGGHRGQGIGNHDVNEENQRQAKVVPFRNEGKGSGKRRAG
jgi:CBS domain-containing protein